MFLPKSDSELMPFEDYYWYDINMTEGTLYINGVQNLVVTNDEKYLLLALGKYGFRVYL